MTVGRPKKVNGDRYKGGRLKRPHQRDGTQDVALASRAVDAVRQNLLDHRWGSRLGQLALAFKITEPCMQAGERYAQLCRSYYVLIGAPSPAPAILERTPGRTLELDPFDKDAVQHAKQTERAYNKALAVLMSLTNPEHIIRALNDLCIKDEHVTYDRLLHAKRGLGALAIHFNLTRDGKSENVGNHNPK